MSNCLTSCECEDDIIHVFTPGKPIDITWAEYSSGEGCIVTGVPYYIEDAPIPGWYLPQTDGEGLETDLIITLGQLPENPYSESQSEPDWARRTNSSSSAAPTGPTDEGYWEVRAIPCHNTGLGAFDMAGAHVYGVSVNGTNHNYIALAEVGDDVAGFQGGSEDPAALEWVWRATKR